MVTRTDADVAAGTRSSADELRRQADAVRDDLKGLGRAAKDVAKEKLGDARKTAGDYLDHGKERASHIEDQIEGYIRQKPLQSVLIAAGAGVLLGFLLSRR